MPSPFRYCFLLLLMLFPLVGVHAGAGVYARESVELLAGKEALAEVLVADVDDDRHGGVVLFRENIQGHSSLQGDDCSRRAIFLRGPPNADVFDASATKVWNKHRAKNKIIGAFPEQEFIEMSRHFFTDPKLVKGWVGLFRFPNLRVDLTWLGSASKWIDEGGGEFVSLNASTFYRKNGKDIFEIKNGSLLGNTKADFDLDGSGNPLGDPVGGYQVVKIGDEVKLRRAPDASSYVGTPYYDRLTEHPNAHVLERHGHDVTDDALVKRANDGIAPDGSTTQSGNPPSYSSKFESPDKIKDVLDNVGPDTPNWNPPASGSSYAFDYPISGSAQNSFGYGIPSGGGSPVSMNRVMVVYKKDGGVWKLHTMYPQP